MKAKLKRTNRGCWIVEYGFEHATFGERKCARAFADGFNLANYLHTLIIKREGNKSEHLEETKKLL
jgi:hypothetical protein